jgi:hypothetical protein
MARPPIAHDGAGLASYPRCVVAGLAVINAVRLHRLEMQDAALAAWVEVATQAVADLDRRLCQIDSTIEEAAKHGVCHALRWLSTSSSIVGATVRTCWSRSPKSRRAKHIVNIARAMEKQSSSLDGLQTRRDPASSDFVRCH